MKRSTVLILVLCLLATKGFAQQDTSAPAIPEVFTRIAASMKDFRPDTSDVPNDKVTRKIRELRSLRDGFTIDNAIAMAGTSQGSDASSNARRLLDNAVVWIYRNHFTYRELKQLVRFYRTPAGRKLSSDFPIVMMQAAKAAEVIMAMYRPHS